MRKAARARPRFIARSSAARCTSSRTRRRPSSTKLAEGAYRDLNIALANELAQVADIHGVDISEVIRAANSQPYSHLHMPGTGVGGHCIPVYPQFLMQGEGPSALSALGRQVNDAMPGYAVSGLSSCLATWPARACSSSG